MQTKIQEKAGAVAKSGGRLRVKIITPGQGSSGMYPAETLAAAAESGVFAAGTHMYINHASPTETYDRPEGDVRNLAGTLTEDAHLDTDGSLVAEAKLYGHWAVIKEMAEDIGVSIRGNAEFEESNGQRVITRIAECTSVDFVTRAGRGGKILEVLESARPTTTQAVEAMAGDVSEWLEKALGQGRYLIDFDADTAVWREWRDEDSGFYAQQYSLAGTKVTFEGEPREVNREQVFRAVDDDGDTEPPKAPTPPKSDGGGDEPSNRTSTQESEAPVPDIKITEAEHKRLTEAETENKQLREEIAEARRNERRTVVEGIVNEAFDGIDAPKHRARLIEAGTNAEEFDAETFKTDTVEEASAYRPAGGVSGLGTTTATHGQTTGVTESDVLKIMKQEA